MKQILIILLCLLWGTVQAQTIGYLRYDTVKIYTTKVGGRGSLDVTGAVRFTGLLAKSAGTDSVLVRDATGFLGTVAKTSIGSGWGLTGNAGTTDVSNFLGTTDGVDFLIKTAGNEIARFSGDVNYRIGLGLNATASGAFSFALSDQSVASGSSSLAMNGGEASGDFSFAHGQNTHATGSPSYALGEEANATAQYAFAFGDVVTTSSGNSVAMGANVNVSGTYGMGFGGFIKAKSFGGTAVGYYNDSTNAASSTVFNTANRVFQIGIGTADNARANAMTVLFSGKTTLNKYGVGTFTGTPATYPAFNSSGDIIESASPFGGTWQQTLTAGSTLTGSNTINGGGFDYVHQNNNLLQLKSGSGSTIANLLLDAGGASAEIGVQRTGANSVIAVYPDSIKIAPHIGRLIIDTLNYSANADDSMMVWRKSTGYVGMRAIPSGGSSGITVGTTTITSGTNTRILYNNSGVVGEYTLTGTGTTVMMAASPTTTGTLTAAAITASGLVTASAGILSSNDVNITRNANAGNSLILTNVNAGTAAYDIVEMNNGTSSAYQFKLGTNYSTSGVLVGGRYVIDNNDAAGTYIGTRQAGPVGFFTGGLADANTRLLISSAGVVTISDLAGTGSRAVVASSTGVLSATQPAFTTKYGSFSGVGTATTVFTVTFGGTLPNATYSVNVTPTAALSAALFYVTNKSTTSFDVTYLAGLTGSVLFDWTLTQ